MALSPNTLAMPDTKLAPGEEARSTVERGIAGCKPIAGYIPVSSRNLKDLSLEHFSANLVDGLSQLTNHGNVNSKAEQYFRIVSQTLEKHAPLKWKVQAQTRNARWVTTEIKAVRLLRLSNEARWRRTGLEVHRQIFKEHRDYVHRLIASAKKAYYEQRISCHGIQETFAVLAG